MKPGTLVPEPCQIPKGQEATFGSLAVKERPAAIEADIKTKTYSATPN